MARWHHWLDGRESDWTPGVGDGQGGWACCDSWGLKVRHDWATELNWTAPWKKSYEQPRQHIKEQKITLTTKVYLVKAMVYPIVMYGCESWTIKTAENWSSDAFEMRWWRRPLRVLWTARKSSQSILKEISPKYSLEGLMLKLKLQYFGVHLMQRTDSLEKTLILGKIEGRRRGQQRMRWLYGITDSMDMSLSKL